MTSIFYRILLFFIQSIYFIFLKLKVNLFFKFSKFIFIIFKQIKKSLEKKIF